MGMKAIAKLPFESAKPLLEKMMDCVQIQPSPNVTRELMSGDVEEVATLFALRKKVLGLHLDFFTAAVPSTSGSKSTTAARA
jgi:hypothetical protein